MEEESIRAKELQWAGAFEKAVSVVFGMEKWLEKRFVPDALDRSEVRRVIETETLKGMLLSKEIPIAIATLSFAGKKVCWATVLKELSEEKAKGGGFFPSRVTKDVARSTVGDYDGPPARKGE